MLIRLWTASGLRAAPNLLSPQNESEREDTTTKHNKREAVPEIRWGGIC